MSTAYDEELLQEIATEVREGLAKVIPDSGEYFSRLASEFPTTGSRIDWDSVPNAVTAYSESVGQQQIDDFIEFFDKTVADHGLEGHVIYMGDSATNVALVLSLTTLRNHLSAFISIPQHHYFVAENFDWCLAFTFEGDMGFGRRPSI